jgi:hypothetical protein
MGRLGTLGSSSQTTTRTSGRIGTLQYTPKIAEPEVDTSPQDDWTKPASVETRAGSIQKGIDQKLSLDQISESTGLTKQEIAQYTDQYVKGYGAQNPLEAVGSFVGDIFKTTTGIVRKPTATIVAATNEEVRKGIESQVRTANEAYQRGQISKAKLEEKVQELTGDIIGASYKVTDAGVEQMNKEEKAGKFVSGFVEAGVGASNVLPTGLAFGAGKKLLLEQGFGAAAKEIAKLNAKQALVVGTAQTASDALGGNEITAETLAINYGAPLILGVAGELAGIGINKLKVNKALSGSIKEAEAIKGSKLTPDEVKTITNEVKTELIKTVKSPETDAGKVILEESQADLEKKLGRPLNDAELDDLTTKAKVIDDTLKTQVPKPAKIEPVEASTIEPTKVDTPEITPPKLDPAKEQFKSRVFERMQAENPNLEGDVMVNRARLKQNLDKAVDIIETDKQRAYDLAMGTEVSDEVTGTAVNIAMSEKALADGNDELAAKLIMNRSLAQTRRGQELVAERGSITGDSTSDYVKELVSRRMDKLSKNYLDVKSLVGKKSVKQKAIDMVDKEVTKLEKTIKAKKLDVKSAIALLDGMTCL